MYILYKTKKFSKKKNFFFNLVLQQMNNYRKWIGYILGDAILQFFQNSS